MNFICFHFEKKVIQNFALSDKYTFDNNIVCNNITFSFKNHAK